jgi:penicillin-insensitive murein endopeptidase/LysM domain-containing protein
MRTHRGVAAVSFWLALGTAVPVAGARSHVVGPGESLWVIARANRCDVDRLRKVNRLSGTMIRPGQKLRIPSCEGRRVAVKSEPSSMDRRPVGLQSIGSPQHGRLANASLLPRNPAAYFIRRPERAYGTRRTVDLIQRVIQRVRRHFPRVHALAIGDLSVRKGGKITMHGSHQSGRDVDLGFYFVTRPKGYPAAFALATEDNLDVAACFALFTALADTEGKPGGVERIYMTYETQALFHRLGRERGISRATLDRLFQYPHGPDSDHGLMHDEPGHDEHIHVRFACPPGDRECR